MVLAADAQESRGRGDHQVLWRLARMRTGWVGAALLVLMIGVALAAPLVAPYSFGQMSLENRLKPPNWLSGGSSTYLLGTDPLGRDMLSRVIWAARTSLGIAGISVLVAMVFGVMMGLLSGYYGGWLDGLVMRLADIQLSFPYLLLAIAVMALLKPTLANLILVLALRSWVVYARTVRGSVLVAKQREFVEATAALGATDRRIMMRHITPNVIAPIIVISSFQLAELIIAESSLSFLGLGVQPPTPSWGGMLSQGREYLTTAWWLGVFPGLAIILTVLGINLFGDALRDAMDPRLKV
jgi:peptide/nickel transport system permease protein